MSYVHYRQVSVFFRVWFSVNAYLLGQFLNGPKIQQPAPYFEGMAVIGDEFKMIKLTDFKGKYLVLFFYPMDL